MGMLIEEIIRDIETNILPFEHRESLYETLNILRKYQKIQEILRWNNAPSPYYKPDVQLFREICEVIEDGNVD